MRINKRYILIFSSIIFILSLISNTYCTGNCQDTSYGFLLLLIGWMGIFMGGAGLCWLANPLLIVSWLVYKNDKSSVILSGIALFIAGSFMFFDEIIIDEAGHYGKINKYLLGYYLWLFSIFIYFTGSLFIYLHKKRHHD